MSWPAGVLIDVAYQVRKQWFFLFGMILLSFAIATAHVVNSTLAVLAVVAIPLLLLVFMRPHVGLLLYVFLLLSLPPFAKNVEFFARGIRIDQLLLFVLSALLIVRYPLGRARIHIDSIVLLYCLYLLAFVVSIILSKIVLGTGFVVGDLVNWQGHLRPLLVYLLYKDAVRNYTEAKSVILVSVGVGGIAVLLGLLQFFRVEPISTLLSTYYARKFSFEAVLDWHRVYSIFDGQPNTFGTFLMMYITLGASLFVHCARNLRSQAVLLALLVSATAALVVSESRAAWIAAAVSLLMLGLLSGRRALPTMILGLATAVGVGTANERAARHFELLLAFKGRGGEPLFATRLPYWDAATKAIESPIFGLGVTPVLDTLYLREFANRGVVGLCLFSAIVIVVLWRGYQAFTKSPSGLVRALSCSLVAMTFGLLVHGVSHPSFYLERVSELYWVIVALVLSASDWCKAEEDRHGVLTQSY